MYRISVEETMAERIQKDHSHLSKITFTRARIRKREVASLTEKLQACQQQTTLKPMYLNRYLYRNLEDSYGR